MPERNFTVIESAPGKKKKGVAVLVVLLVIAAALVVLFTQFKIRKITFTGNKHFSDREMYAELQKHGFVDNTVIFFLRYKIDPPKDVPFVEDMDCQITGRNSLKVDIYEKTMAGCIENMGDYMYFDRNGIVLESSSEKFDDVPLITGLKFDSAVINEKLPFKDKKTVRQILNITQLIRKYKLSIDSVRFADDQVYLVSGDIEVALGSPSDVDEKMAELPNMLEAARKRKLKGILHMEKFDVSNGTATFQTRGSSGK